MSIALAARRLRRATEPLVAAALLLASCKASEGDAAAGADSAAGESAATSPNVVTFTAAQVQHGGVRWAALGAAGASGALEVPGQLVPDEDRTARIGAPVRGRVVRVHVQPGERVRAGQPLVTLQSQEASTVRADYEKAVAELASRRAAATYARTARERAERLLAAKALARQELERAQADEELARSALAQAEAEVRRARGALSQVGGETADGMVVIAAPFAGVVLARDATPGSVAEAGAALVSITDPSSLWLEASVPDRAASSLATGGAVRFVVPAYPTDTFVARVASIGGALDASTRTVPVRAAVRNPIGRLRPAMFATAWIPSAGGTVAAVSVPEAAVQMLDERPVVFVATPDGAGGARFERRAVELGGTAGGRTEVRRGVSAGEVVVTEGAFAVKSEFSRAKMAKG
ncbi:MAG: efflux RND transporter periplasmic adaptor subunit [Gemmatimonadaceae bacterium]